MVFTQILSHGRRFFNFRRSEDCFEISLFSRFKGLTCGGRGGAVLGVRCCKRRGDGVGGGYNGGGGLIGALLGYVGGGTSGAKRKV